MSQTQQNPFGWITPFDAEGMSWAITGCTMAIMRKPSEKASVALYLSPAAASVVPEPNRQLIETLQEVRDTLTRLAWDENPCLLEKVNAALADHEQR